MNDLINEFAGWVRQHLIYVSTAFVSCLMAMYGGAIGGAVKNSVQKYNFFLRVTVFVLLCAFGYGAVGLLLAKLLKELLSQLSFTWLAGLVAAMFVFIGILAEQKNKI